MLAVILKKNVFAEGSEVVTLYSREEGKVRAVARSIKSAKSKLSFGLQDLFLSDVEVAASRRSGSLATITGVKPISTFMNLRESDEAVHLALFATELLLKSTPDHEPDPALYDLFVSYLEHLDSALAGATSSAANAHPLCRTCYTLRFLELIGYGVNLRQCAVCKRDLFGDSSSSGAGGDTVFFSLAKSGFLCGADAGHAPGAVPVDVGALRLLANAAAANFGGQDELAAAARVSAGSSLAAVESAVQGFAVHVLERELKTARYV